MKLSGAIVCVLILQCSMSFSPQVNIRTRSQQRQWGSKVELEMTAEENTDVKDIKVGVIGCGRIGIVHLGAISKSPNVTPVIVSNPTVSKAEAAASQYGVPRFTSDAMDVITDPEVDAVWICSPSQYHAEQIKACAANGKVSYYEN